MSFSKRYTITAALPYANGPLHLGHFAGVYLPSDIFARFLRLKDIDVAFVCGSDEHGAAITLRAKKQGISPKDIIDKYHIQNKAVFEKMGISFDVYDRTSSKEHEKVAQQYFLELKEKGVFHQKTTEQYYDEENQMFLADRYIQGRCPKCSEEGAYGDQCEKCGSSLSALELINPVSTLSEQTPVLRETTHWFLNLDQYEKWLENWIINGKNEEKTVHEPKEWKNQVVGQCMSWLKMGLKPRAMTRDLDWGVPVPLENSEGKVMYVWFDAPFGYISATQKWARENSKNWKDYWQDDQTELVHFLAKDNIVFHTIIFPIILNVLDGFILPKNVPANEFLNLEGQKLSTSRNWAVWVNEYLEIFPEGQDVMRYVLTSIMPETKDSDFSWKDFQNRNNELVGIFGNFVNRTMVLTNKYYQGVVPECGEFSKADNDLIKSLELSVEKIETSIKEYRFREAIFEAMNIARLGNKYLAEQEPWKLIKTDENRVKTIMYCAIQVVAKLSVVFQPFMPFTCEKLAKMMNLDLKNWEQSNEFDLVQSGHLCGKPELLFSKIDDEWIEQRMESLYNF